MMKYSTILWDLDGTLLDTLGDLTDSVNHVLQAHGMPTHTEEEIRSYVGNGLRNLIARSVPPQTAEEERDRIYEEFCPYYAAHCNEKTAPYPGVPELLAELRAAGIRMAIVSNKGDFAVRELANLYFRNTVPTAVGARDGVPTKPARALVDLALDELQADGAQAVYIGDSEVDVQTAHNAGLPCVSAAWGFRTEDALREAGATCICRDVSELRRILLATP